MKTGVQLASNNGAKGTIFAALQQKCRSSSPKNVLIFLSFVRDAEQESA
jgi:hypothetical protein